MAAIVGIVASLVGPAIELGKCIIAPIKREFSYLCCFNSHIEKLKDEAKKLEDATAGLQMKADAAERNAEQIIPEVRTWLTSANNEIQVNMSGIENEVPNVQSGCSAIISRYTLSKKAKKTTDSMKELRDGCSKFDRISMPAPPAAMVPIPLGQTYEFESRKQIEKDIMEALTSKDINIMGICGMGGVGKTTLAKRIMNKVKEEHLFDEVLMTVVGQQADMLKIQSDISESLDLELGKETLSARAHKLRIRLKGTKRSLIVVDDIWEILKLEDLGIPIESGVEGHCTILLTSRDRGVLNAMEAKKVYAIKTLSENEALFLFKEKSGICSDDFNLFSIGEDIAKECRGLPIALITVGSALKDKKFKPIWEDAFQQLKDSNPIDIPGVLRDVYNPLKLSYDFLDSQHARSLFLLCCLFREDSNISLNDLTLFCMGLRIFEGISNLEQVRNRVFMIVEMLKSRFLILDGSIKHHLVKMHDVVRDVAIFIASKEGFIDVSFHPGEHNSYSECKWISFFPKNRSQLQLDTMRLNFPSLRMLMMHCLSWRGLEIEEFSFLEGMKELSVLSFKFISFKSVPQSMQLLKNLRTLHLEVCTLETISVVGELLSLEILCFRRCGSIKELPIEIGRLNRLKLLEFSNCRELKTIPPGVLSNLIELEELTMVDSFNRWELAEAKEKESRNVNVSLGELQSLLNLMCLNIEIEDETLALEEIHFSSKFVKYHIKLGRVPYENYERSLEKKMHLNLPEGITIGNWIHTFAKSTEELRLSGHVSNILDLLQAPNVKSLHLENCFTMKKLMDTTSIDRWRFDALYLSNLGNLEEICDVPIARESNSFKNLKELNLVNLPALEHLWNNPNQNISLSNLSSIKVQNCGLCSLAIAMDSLSQLQHLWIDSCSMMKQVFSNKGDAKKSHITFPQLKELKLYGLHSLTTFCQEIGSIEFPMLTGIEIRNCPRITSLVSSIENDQNSASTHLFCSQQVSFGIFPTLECLKLTGLHNVEEMYDGPIPMGSNFFKNLKEIEIKELPKLKHLWKSSCQNEQKEKHGEITTHITFQQLGKLVLQNLKNLATFSKGIESIEFPALTHMEIVGCPKLVSLVSSSIENHHYSPNSQDDDSIHLFYKVTFGRLRELTIGGYNNIGKIWCYQTPDSFFTGLERLSIVECDSIRSLFSFAVARNIVNLEDLSIERCKDMVKVIEDVEEITRETNCPLLSLFPRLQVLRLLSLPNLESFCEWRCDLELPVLCSLNISGCPMMKVFTMGSLISAQKLEHIECRKLTSIESPMGLDGNNDDTFPLFCSLKVTFGRLRELIIGGYINISKIWCHQIPNNFFTGLEKLTIVECDGIRGLFSSAIARNLEKLEYLEIKDCKEMVTVIEDEEEITGETNCPLVSLFPSLQDLKMDSLPKLESFCEWRWDLKLPMLMDLRIRECPMMKVFAMGSEQIECPKLTSIESPMGPDGNNDYISSLFCSLKVTFGRSQILYIQRYKKEVIFTFPEYLRIRGCNNISKIWCHQMPDSFFTGLERLTIGECDSIRGLFSSAIARNLVNLENLRIERCKEMVKVIEDEEEITGETNCPLVSLFPSLRSLTLLSLPKLESFCEWRCDLELPMLMDLHIRECPMMKVFAIGSEHIEWPKLTSIESPMGSDDNNDDTSPLFCVLKVKFGRSKNLDIQGYKKKVTFRWLKDLYIRGYNNISKICCHQMPDSFFTGLERLTIVECDSIRGLFSSAIARNLEKLKYLEIKDCKEMVKVVEDEEEITGETNCPLVSLFPRLRFLTLFSLPKLESFCEWRCDLELPVLHSLNISGCPMMKVFTMGSLISAHKLGHIECPKLTSVESPTDPEDNNDDTSPLICSLKVTFGRLRELTIGGYNNINKIWCHQIPDNFFTGLERLSIVECDSIRGLFSSAIARNLVNLKDLGIKRCKRMVNVIEDEEEIAGETNCPLVSLFPSLQSLTLVSLPMLESFYKWRCGLELLGLMSLVICKCPMMKVLSMGSLISAHKLEHIECPKLTTIESPMGLDGNNVDTSPLFCSLKVTFGRLRELTIGGYNDISNIWCHQIPDSFFTGLERLTIVECDSIRGLFSSAIARNLEKLKYLEIKDCKEMVKVVEDEEEITGETNCPLVSLFPRLQFLTLYSLPKLESFCEWRCDLELPVLHSLNISGCPMMKVFTMGSLISAHKLGHIECPKLTSAESSTEPEGNNDNTSHLICSLKVTFGTLRRLNIGGYNNISKIWCHQIPDSFFTGLKKLFIFECDSIRGLFSSAIARNLVNLKDLIIRRCKEMVKVIEDEEEITGETNCPLVSLFPNLRLLTLDSLPKLESFCEWRCNLELPMLMDLNISGCPMIKVFTMGSIISTPKLEYIDIENQRKDVGDLNEVMKLHCYAERRDTGRVEIVE